MPLIKSPSSARSWLPNSLAVSAGSFSLTTRSRPAQRPRTRPVGLGSAEKEMQQLTTTFHRMTMTDPLGNPSDEFLQKVGFPQKVGRVAVTAEKRVPFLERNVVGFSTRVPAGMKVRDGRGKWLVRQVLYRHVPADMIDRPKTGFSIPLDAWLRGPLKSWAADLLSPARLKRQGLFDPARVTRMFDEHLSRHHNHSYWMWNVLMPQAWHDEWAGARWLNLRPWRGRSWRPCPFRR